MTKGLRTMTASDLKQLPDAATRRSCFTARHSVSLLLLFLSAQPDKLENVRFPLRRRALEDDHSSITTGRDHGVFSLQRSIRDDGNDTFFCPKRRFRCPCSAPRLAPAGIQGPSFNLLG
jgi:hypothetical protein